MQKFALIGHKISYSRSPQIHAEIYSELGVDAKYELFSLEESELKGFTDFARESLGGFNITKPYKERIIPYLDGAEGKSVNTVVNREGKLYGYSTDGYGFSKDMQIRFGKTEGTALILGAGGVARVIAEELKKSFTVYIWNRTKETGVSLARELGVNYAQRESVKPNLLVNCTSFGFNAGENPALDGSGALAVNGESLRWVYDTIYSPPQTDLLEAFSCAQTANGYGMLILQAVEADRIMLGREISDEQEKKIYQTLMEKFKGESL